MRRDFVEFIYKFRKGFPPSIYLQFMNIIGSSLFFNVPESTLDET